MWWLCNVHSNFQRNLFFFHVQINGKNQLIINKVVMLQLEFSFIGHQGRAQVQPSLTNDCSGWLTEVCTRVAYVGTHSTCTNKTLFSPLSTQRHDCQWHVVKEDLFGNKQIKKQKKLSMYSSLLFLPNTVLVEYKSQSLALIKIYHLLEVRTACPQSPSIYHTVI